MTCGNGKQKSHWQGKWNAHGLRTPVWIKKMYPFDQARIAFFIIVIVVIAEVIKKLLGPPGSRTRTVLGNVISVFVFVLVFVAIFLANWIIGAVLFMLFWVVMWIRSKLR